MDVAQHAGGAQPSADDREADPRMRAAWIATVALGVGALVLQAYLLLHEGGHALVGLAFGGTLLEFRAELWNPRPHVTFLEDFTGWRQSTLSVAGALLPFAAWVFFMVFVPRRTGPALAMTKLVASAGVVHSLVPWIVLPLVSAPPEGDDVTRFLVHSGLPPGGVALAFAALYLSGLALFFARIHGLRAFFASLAAARLGRSTGREAIGVFGSLGIAIVLATSLGSAAGPPDDELATTFEPTARVELSERDRAAEPVHVFTLATRTVVRMRAVVAGIDSGPFALELHDRDGVVRSLFRGPSDLTVGHATVDTGPVTLDPGAYRILVTSPQNPGFVALSLGEVGVSDGATPPP